MKRLGLLLFAPLSLAAQITQPGGSVSGLTAYYPVAGSNSTTVGTVQTEIDGALFSTGNFCTDLANALTAVGNHFAVVNMRGDASNCGAGSTNPFAGLSSGEVSVTVLMPCDHRVSTTVAWATGATNDLVLKGCGTGGNSGLSAASTFPGSTVLFTQGVSGSLIFGNRVEDMRLDCSGSSNAGCQPFASYGANERSGLFNVQLQGQNSATATVPCATIGDTVSGSAPGHSSFVHVDANKCGANNGITVAADGAGMLHIADITCNNTGGNTGLTCLDFSDSFGSGHTFEAGTAQNIHAEGFTTTVNYGTASSGYLDVADCTGTCTNVLTLSTTLSVSAHYLRSVSSNVNLVSNSNGAASGTTLVTNANSFRVENAYEQCEQVAGSNKIVTVP